MKKIIHSVKSSFRWAYAVVGAAVLAAGIQSASAQSIGVKVVSGDASGIDNSQANSMLPADLAGAPPYAQTNWNNFSRYGSGTFMLNNSVDASYAFNLQWDAQFTDTTGTRAALGTPDGKLLDQFWSTYGPGAATALANSVYNCSANNKPLFYISGLEAWYTAEGAEGYSVVLYCNGYANWEPLKCYLESVSGDPLTGTMVEGSILTPPLYLVDNTAFTGTNYVPVTSTNSGSASYGANYMVFNGFTNDAVLIRQECLGSWSSAVNGFQFVPIFPTKPTANTPTSSPSTVYAKEPVTMTETATGDQFHPNLWYQWFSDNASGGPVTNRILNATNAALTVTPATNASV